MPPAHTSPINVEAASKHQYEHHNGTNNDEDSKLIHQRKTTSTKSELVDETEIPLMDRTFPLQIVWRNVFLFVYLHIVAAYGAYLFITGQVMWQTFIWGALFYFMSGLGITAGCHRYFAHKSYKAKFPLHLMLIYFQTVAFQNSVHEWSRDHRVHHKYSETNADPHNAKRGFFFAHMGWLMCKKHPAIKEKGAGIDMSDLEADPIIMFQKNYYVPVVLTLSFFIPALIPIFCWGESVAAAWCFGVQLRYCLILHWTWLVNSAAHLYGDHPYDKNINPSENRLVALLAMGEGWHNYHHTFPWDYKTAELGNYELNLTALFIDTMAKIGWAYDLKTVPKKIVEQRVARTGDGTWKNGTIPRTNETEQNTTTTNTEEEHGHAGPWGWGDKDIPAEHIAITQTLNSAVENQKAETVS